MKFLPPKQNNISNVWTFLAPSDTSAWVGTFIGQDINLIVQCLMWPYSAMLFCSDDVQMLFATPTLLKV